MFLHKERFFMKFYFNVLAVFFSIAQLCCGYCSPRIAYLDEAPWIGLKMEFTDEITEVLRKEIVDILNPEHPACAFAKKSSLFDLDKQPIHFIKNGKRLIGVLFGNDLIEGMSEQDREQKTDEIPPKVVGKRKTSPKKTKEPKTRG